MTADALSQSPSAISRDDVSHPYRNFAVASLLGGMVWATVVPSEFVLASVAGFVLVLLLVVCVTTDLKNRRIPNWATYSAFLIGLAINLVANQFPQWASWLGAVGVGESFAGGFGILAIMFVIFSLSGGGAGDVKLAASLGALLGWEMVLNAMLYSFIVAGAALACYAIWTIGPLELFDACFRSIGCRLLPGRIAPPPKQQRTLLRKQFPLAPFFASGVAIAIFL